MLTNEYFKADSVVSNTFDVSLQNVGVSITVPASFKNKGKPSKIFLDNSNILLYWKIFFFYYYLDIVKQSLKKIIKIKNNSMEK